MTDEARQEHIHKLTALREAITDEKVTVNLNVVFTILIDALLEALS